MCIPHSPVKSYQSDRRRKSVKQKKSKPFDKKLLEPAPEFKDERKRHYLPKTVSKSVMESFLSMFI